MASITIFFKPTKDTNKQKTFQSDSEREKSALEKTVEKHLPLCAEKTFIQEELSKSTRPKVYCKVPASIRYEVAKCAAVRGPTAAVSHFNKRYGTKYKYTRQTVQGWMKTYRKNPTAKEQKVALAAKAGRKNMVPQDNLLAIKDMILSLQMAGITIGHGLLKYMDWA